MKWIVAALVIWAAWQLLRRPKTSRAQASETAARALLGVGKDADEAAIRAAHRRLMAGAHPDRGGSADDARRLNAARDALLARLSRGA